MSRSATINNFDEEPAIEPTIQICWNVTPLVWGKLSGDGISHF
ncbi:Uncharacterised protein [Mycobacteroides abscessus subsp. abscessus]|uniref:Uncharacterized protein n=1 Tax=Mycobacteroides abscessus subsp. abscessus TaxID=1185650 RepID=A0AB74FFW8_9MYCO|nr:hypothetical protein [Mycobacteroides abscessus]SHO92573.1 Uncharacterised protein [Mycobacteroides abscessus subsp. abscessus]MBE5413333.1 hypothetical protein [Mycobacteroides abscessus]MBE5418401.1 hypothetical protein [Mycobacteroides abscessus]MBE5424719.1 hypothetical protein [Mycobacteroides abscessus]